MKTQLTKANCNPVVANIVRKDGTPVQKLAITHPNYQRPLIVSGDLSELTAFIKSHSDWRSRIYVVENDSYVREDGVVIPKSAYAGIDIIEYEPIDLD